MQINIQKPFVFVFMGLILTFFVSFAEARFLGFGSKVGPGAEILDYNRGLKIMAPTSEWNLSTSAKLVTLTHSKYYDVYVSLQESIYKSQAVEKIFKSRKKSLIEFDPTALFLIEKESLKMAGNEALSFTYQDVDKGKIIQEIFFVHRRVPYHLSISANIKNMEKIQEEINALIANVKALKIEKKLSFQSEQNSLQQSQKYSKPIGI